MERYIPKLVTCHQCINHSQKFIGVAPDVRRVAEDKPDFFLVVNDENIPDARWDLVGVDDVPLDPCYS